MAAAGACSCFYRDVIINLPPTIPSVHHRYPFAPAANPFVSCSPWSSASCSRPARAATAPPLLALDRRLIDSGPRLNRRRNDPSRFVRCLKASGSSSVLKEEQERIPNNQRQNPAEKQGGAMTIKPTVRISSKGKLLVNGRTVLTGVPAQVTSSSAAGAGPSEGVYLGAEFDKSSSRHVVSLGTLRDLRFMASFRFKLWWMSQKMGKLGRRIPLETQFLLLELPAAEDGEDVLYTVFLPLVEGPFRACIQGNSDDEVQLCIESGDAQITSSSFTHSLYVGAAKPDPFEAITDAIRAVKRHLKTFRQRHEKRLPPIVDCFGWCTWDAFYQDVTQEGVESGLQTLAAGGVPPKFVIIDDGWQSVGQDEKVKQKEGDVDPKPPVMRLTGIKENSKFQTKGDGAKGDCAVAGIEKIVRIAKEKYKLDYVYIWHAITGYWGGVRPGVEGMEQYGSEMRYPKISPGVAGNEPAWEVDQMAVQGMGLVNPRKAFRFYDDLHAYLASAGVDGVKVDVQCILETLGGGFGGRVELTRQYHQALDASVSKNFPGNGIIACMSHNTDGFYCSKQTAVIRASDDFWPRDPVSHTIHIASVAYNSIFLGEFMVPDWDMFHTVHPAAEYHASARAISGGPVYVSDAPGNHNFELLRKLVLPDGSILRARLPGRPTRDCLFNDPARDGVTLLKIWNMNKFTGVLGVYNCQGAAWSSTEKKYVFHKGEDEELALTGAVKGSDVHLISQAATDTAGTWNGDCALYRHGAGDLTVLPSGASLPVTLKILEHCIFTVSPVKILAPGFRFAPIGLLDMYNAGGAIEGVSYHHLTGDDDGHGPLLVSMEVKGCGRVGSYSSAKPSNCSVNSVQLDYSYDSSSGLLVFNLDKLPEDGKKTHQVVVEY